MDLLAFAVTIMLLTVLIVLLSSFVACLLFRYRYPHRGPEGKVETEAGPAEPRGGQAPAEPGAAAKPLFERYVPPARKPDSRPEPPGTEEEEEQWM